MTEPDEYDEFEGRDHDAGRFYRLYRYGCWFVMTEDGEPFINREHPSPELASAEFGEYAGSAPKAGDTVEVYDRTGGDNHSWLRVDWVSSRTMEGYPDLPEHHVVGVDAASTSVEYRLTPGSWQFVERVV